MKLLFSIFIAVLCLTVIQAQIKPTFCGPKKQILQLKKFDVDGCQEMPCILTRGKNASVTMEFTPTQKVNGLKLSIAGILSGKEVPFSVNDNDHCKMAIKNGKCPLVRNTTYKYTNSISVLKEYPAISVSIRYQINDSSGRALLCIQWGSKIV
jgi:Niemann-Pick C2 protein